MVVALILRNNHSNISSLFPSDAPSDSRLSLSSLVAGHDFQDGTGEKKCSLLGPVGLIVQASMGVLVVLSLVIKRQFEGGKGKAKRKWKIWGMDVGKQLIGQGFVHFLNVGISDGLAHYGANPCSLYFLNVLVDTTLGVLFLYLSLKSLTWLCEKVFGAEHGFRSGLYGNPPTAKPFLLQLLLYLLSLTFMKLFVILLFFLTAEKYLLPMTDWLIGWMEGDLQVVVVMAVFPLIMNVIQFCLVDQLIKGASPDRGLSVKVGGAPKDIEEPDENNEVDEGRYADRDHSNDRNRGASTQRKDTGSRTQSRRSSFGSIHSDASRLGAHLSPSPDSPSASARAPLLTSVSRRTSPLLSPKTLTGTLSVILAILFMVPGAMASSGDRHPVFQACLAECVDKHCTPDGPQLNALLRLFLWSCSSDCAYQCTHQVTNTLVEAENTVHQFYGKWPFWRLAGIQEPASVLFSIGNAYVHWKGWQKVQYRTRGSVGLRGWILGLGMFQMNTWFWSAVFHTRDTPLTEKMDYFSATATILYTLLFTLVRLFHLFPQQPQYPSGKPAMYYLIVLFLILYTSHISYLLSGPRFDYGWNIIFNLMAGSMHLGMWALFSLSFTTRLPWPFSLIPTPYPPFDPISITPKPKWSGTSAILVLATTAAMSLELFDFAPFFRIIDAHSLWHLATIFIARGWYNFLITDAAMLQALKTGMSSNKAVDYATAT